MAFEKKEMEPEKLRLDIKNCTTTLLAMARDHCWNMITDEVVYIISEIKDDEETRQKGMENRRSKDKLESMDFDRMSSQLATIYPKVHDINLYVHRAEQHRTIVDVRYYLKANVGYETKPETPSMLHAKIALPPYRGDGSQKFDVHWEFGGLRHQWRMFWWRQRMQRERNRRRS